MTKWVFCKKWGSLLARLEPEIDARPIWRLVTRLLGLGHQAWLDAVPDNLAESAAAEALRSICNLDLSELESIEPPRGFGRD